MLGGVVEAAHGLQSVIFRYFNVAGADPDGDVGEQHIPETHLIPLILDAIDGRRPAQIAKHGGSVSLRSNADGPLGGFATLRYIGAQNEDDLGLLRLDDALTLDAGLSWRLADGISVEARGENLFDEPVPAKGHDGAIFLWVHPVEGGKLVEMPRAYRLAYQKDLRGILEDGMKKARDGNAQMGTTTPRRGPSGSSWLRPAGNEDLEIRLSDVPRAQLPEK